MDRIADISMIFKSLIIYFLLPSSYYSILDSCPDLIPSQCMFRYPQSSCPLPSIVISTEAGKNTGKADNGLTTKYNIKFRGSLTMFVY